MNKRKRKIRLCDRQSLMMWLSGVLLDRRGTGVAVCNVLEARRAEGKR